MRRYGVGEGMITVCKNVKASVLLDGEESRWFGVDKGLRQGCPLSPLLNSIYMMGMVEELKGEKLGVELGGVWCGGLLYADDIVLIAGSEEELQRMLNVVGLYAREWKFRFNSKKSKVMVLGRGAGRWKLCQFDENRLVAKVVACGKEIGGKGWGKELENLRGKYGIGDESVSGLMDKVSEKVISD